MEWTVHLRSVRSFVASVSPKTTQASYQRLAMFSLRAACLFDLEAGVIHAHELRQSNNKSSTAPFGLISTD